jgi:hypothetical protein
MEGNMGRSKKSLTVITGALAILAALTGFMIINAQAQNSPNPPKPPKSGGQYGLVSAKVGF